MLRSHYQQAHSCSSRKTIQALLALLLAFPNALQAKNYNYSDSQFNQKDAGGFASNNYYNGSGDSKDEGVRNAMRALNRLASMDIGGAFHYGYKGYGNYINSQKMDDLDSQAWKVKNSMGSIGTNMLSAGSNTSGQGNNGSKSDVSSQREPAQLAGNADGRVQASGESTITGRKLSEMDRSFLYRGETAEVAAEFERKSGMNREVFFNHLAEAEESGLSWDDPEVLNKFEHRYQAFMKQIPNQEYRANIEKMHALFNLAKKTKILEEGAAFYRNLRWGEGEAKVAGQDAKPRVSELSAAGNNATEAKTEEKSARNPASELSSEVDKAFPKGEERPGVPALGKVDMYLGLEGTHGDELKELVGSDDTIFLVVSKRYRKLTPMLVGKVNVLNSK